MPTSTLTGDLAGIINRLSVTIPPGIALRPLVATDSASLAQLYLDSYPPGVAVADLAEAQADVDATFNGEYGEIWPAASLVATSYEGPVGSIQVVRRSIWDGDPQGPFIIELFVSPAVRHQGIATAAARPKCESVPHGRTGPDHASHRRGNLSTCPPALPTCRDAHCMTRGDDPSKESIHAPRAPYLDYYPMNSLSAGGAAAQANDPPRSAQ